MPDFHDVDPENFGVSLTIFKTIDFDNDPPKLLTIFRGKMIESMLSNQRPQPTPAADSNAWLRHVTPAPVARMTPLPEDSMCIDSVAPKSESPSNNGGHDADQFPTPDSRSELPGDSRFYVPNNLSTFLTMREPASRDVDDAADTAAPPQPNVWRAPSHAAFDEANPQCKDCGRSDLPALYSARIYVFQTRCWLCRIAKHSANIEEALAMVGRDVARARTLDTEVKDQDVDQLEAELRALFALPPKERRPRTARAPRDESGKRRKLWRSIAPAQKLRPGTAKAGMSARAAARKAKIVESDPSDDDDDDDRGPEDGAEQGPRRSAAVSSPGPRQQPWQQQSRATTQTRNGGAEATTQQQQQASLFLKREAAPTSGQYHEETFGQSDRDEIAALRRRQDDEMQRAMARAQVNADIKMREEELMSMKRKRDRMN